MKNSSIYFNVLELIDMVSYSILQLPFKTLLCVKFGCRIKNNAQNHKKDIKLLVPFSTADQYEVLSFFYQPEQHITIA